MTLFFTHEEASILLRLLIAHCLTDFFLQPNKWVADKREKLWKSNYLWYHGILTGVVAWVFLAEWNLWWVVLLITTTHILTDGYKLQAERKWGTGVTPFLVDQFIHFLFIVISWLWIVDGWTKMNDLLHYYLANYRVLILILGYVLMIEPVGYVIHFLTRKWQIEINPEDSLKNAGKWIGILERVLTLTFVFTNQFSAIGFLIAAKSVLRVIDKPDKPTGDPTLIKPFSSRKRTEYVLIGTLLSFSIAIFTGLIINWLLSL